MEEELNTAQVFDQQYLFLLQKTFENLFILNKLNMLDIDISIINDSELQICIYKKGHGMFEGFVNIWAANNVNVNANYIIQNTFLDYFNEIKSYNNA